MSGQSAPAMRSPSILKVSEVNGAPGWLLDGKPYVPIMAQAGRGGFCEVRDGMLWLEPGLCVRIAAPAGLGGNFSAACALACDSPAHSEGSLRLILEGKTAKGDRKHYSVKLESSAACLSIGQNEGVFFLANGTCVVRKSITSNPGKPILLRLVKRGAILRLEADGLPLGEWTDPDPMVVVDSLALSAFAAKGRAANLTLENGSGKLLLEESLGDSRSVRERFKGDILPLYELPQYSFFKSGCSVYTTWENGPQLSLVWKEDGSYDWSEVDGYLRKLAAFDPNGRLQCRFFFDTPQWWAQKNPEHMVQVRQENGETRVTDIISFASKPYWDEAEKAARDLVRFCSNHPEGWRFIGVLYHSGVCEWFPHYGEGFSDYSPVFLAGFREWLHSRHSTVEQLRAAWKNDKVTFETAELPTPADRLRGDYFDFYDPAKGLQRQDFCAYYSQVVTSLMGRLAKAFKEESDGRIYTRVAAGYQPAHEGFRYHAGPHADFSAVLNCPWIDGFFMTHDYRGHGHGGFNGFQIPLASVLLHGKTFIVEIDDRTHHVTPPSFRSTATPWQTAQSIKRDVASAICEAAGAEFKDWALGWFEDEETMPVIKRLNELAQESATLDRTPIAQIAVVINPQSAYHLRDNSSLFQTLNTQQMNMCYPRIGAPHDKIMIDDLDKAREYRFYIIQDAFHLSDAQRKMIREKVCTQEHTVLWLYAPGIIGDGGISVEAMGELIGMRIRPHAVNDQLSLHLSNSQHPYTHGVLAGTALFTMQKLTPRFYVDDSHATALGMGGNRYGEYWGDIKPAFAVKKMHNWTSVYCSIPVLPPAVIRNIASEAGVHIYSRMDDFVTANNWLLTVCAASKGQRTIYLPREAKVTDALTGEVVANATDRFNINMEFGETHIWKTE